MILAVGTQPSGNYSSGGCVGFICFVCSSTGQLDIILNYNDSPVRALDYFLRRKKIVHDDKNVAPAGIVFLGG